ncbi:unnamed protein product [Didymodactylos carnosus]|uniref:SP-RING-type domain-containing protein n=1 Tax=Didymodactylos carnosus TaxID=1234261 RepID=A0A814GL21_9BILA|nr:unnamed protein product [Didymodactylos carnosus]CAF1112248.1 unnamed protein product [Didymodactylos carnosus]CAF3769258.1 unnamed protein product [Didymodactylos carnosus]CAF3880676.1 unnamed protein product [Didymodactylos carnosus]
MIALSYLELADDQLFDIVCRYYTPPPFQTTNYTQLLEQCMFIIDQYYSQDLEQLIHQMRQRRFIQPNTQQPSTRTAYQMPPGPQRQSVPFVQQNNNRFYPPQQYQQQSNNSQMPIQQQQYRYSQPRPQQQQQQQQQILPRPPLSHRQHQGQTQQTIPRPPPPSHQQQIASHPRPIIQQSSRPIYTQQPQVVNQVIQQPAAHLIIQTPVTIPPTIQQPPRIPAPLPSSSSSSNNISVIVDGTSGHPSVPLPPIVHKILPFYTLIRSIYENGQFKFDQNKKLHLCHLKFRLDLDSCNQIAESYDYDEDYDQIKARYCLILRLARIDQQPTNLHLGYDDSLPPNLIVQLNSQNVSLPVPKPCTRQNTDLIRNGREIDITEQAMLSPSQLNTLAMQWQLSQQLDQYQTAKYAVHIYLMKRQYIVDLVQEVKEKRVKLEKSDLRQIYAQSNGGDSDLCVSDYKIMLKCPINQCRLKIPARATTCQHLQCFDLYNYIAMNEKSSKWLCPVCSRPALYDQLRLDHYTETILSATKDSTTEIKIDSNLDWSPILTVDQEHQVSSTTSDNAESCILLDEDDEEDSKASIKLNYIHLQEKPNTTENEIILLDD